MRQGGRLDSILGQRINYYRPWRQVTVLTELCVRFGANGRMGFTGCYGPVLTRTNFLGSGPSKPTTPPPSALHCVNHFDPGVPFGAGRRRHV